MTASATILVVEDEKLIRITLRERLRQEGFHVEEAEAGLPALQRFGETDVDLVLLDYRLPDVDGIEVLRRLREQNSDVPVILMTAYSTVDSAVEALKLGAYDYMTKPVDHDHLLANVAKALETTRLRREVRQLRSERKSLSGVTDMIGGAPAMVPVMRMVEKIAGEAAATTVLLEGESGTGKDLVAKTLHYSSSRADRPFMNITCSALPETLLESELFGHERGAFTDAKKEKKGLLELADGGTVFLDEISEMGLSPQSKLLRFLEERSFKRVGGVRDISVEVGVIAATNRDLGEAVREGRFREDLYYRLKVIPIVVPPLRQRKEDIPSLVRLFVDQFNREFKKQTHGFSDEAMKCLIRHDWPGNVRELRNVVERALILENKEVLDVEDLPEELMQVAEEKGFPASEQGGSGRAADIGILFELPDDGVSLRELERDLVGQALERCGGNQSRAARMLRISRDTLRYKMKKFKLG